MKKIPLGFPIKSKISKNNVYSVTTNLDECLNGTQKMVLNKK